MNNLVETIDTANDRVKIEIHYDSDVANPRKEWDNLAVMLCAHRRYDLGDEELSSNCSGWEAALHKWIYDDNQSCSQWVDQKLRDQYEEEYNAYRDTLGPDDEDEWYDSQWWYENGVEDGEPHPLIAKWLEENAVVNNLYLYDHSGITISNSSFSCNWDSGQVGFILLLKGKALDELTCDKKDWREAAQRCIDGEVEVYDDYLTGEVYGYVITVDGEHEESCWGYYGYDHEKSGLMYQARESAEYEIKQLAKEADEAAYWAARDVVTV